MIKRYNYGTPIATGAVITELPVSQGDIPGVELQQKNDGLVLTIRLDADDVIYGLGETTRGLNKRGHIYRSWNSDDFSHTENKNSLYASHNFIIVAGKDRLFGLFIDDPGLITWDLGYTEMNLAVITLPVVGQSIYYLEGENPADLCRQLRSLTGRSYIPPKWAFGYIQSRWGYASSEDALRVVREHRERRIPIDGLCMDIDYMEGYRDFTWGEKQIPDLKALTDELHDEHVRLIPIIDAGIKQDPGFNVYDEGHDKGYFTRKADGEEFSAGVWPGLSCFPDFLRPEVRKWFGDQYHPMLANGVEGFWNDMNEPALFYTPEKLAEMRDKAKKLLAADAALPEWEQLKHMGGALANNMEDYQRFYHETKAGRVRHDRVHNIYGGKMTQAAAEGFESFDPKKRFLLFSRASYIGAHRYGGVWQGDNSSWWSHLGLNLRMMASLNMVGFLYCGADIGGFSCDTTADLMLRWLELALFSPLMRNHSALGTREQEAYRFSNWEDMRGILSVRYALIPYLYSEYMQAALDDRMLFRPLGFDYPQDDDAVRTEDQVLFGHGVMLAPVMEQNARGRHVYLPEDMMLIRFRSADDFDMEAMEAGHHWVRAELNEVPVFIRRNAVLPICVNAAESVDQLKADNMLLLGWIDSGKTVDLPFYDDDGFTTAPSLERGLRRITVTAGDASVSASCPGMQLNTECLMVE